MAFSCEDKHDVRKKKSETIEKLPLQCARVCIRTCADQALSFACSIASTQASLPQATTDTSQGLWYAEICVVSIYNATPVRFALRLQLDLALLTHVHNKHISMIWISCGTQDL